MNTETIIFGLIGVALGYYLVGHYMNTGRPA